jgi:glyoxylase-like metal-dependent hydrolase (beta-lactamase superfamily II)/rhodanese-related sulfurtransferase
MFFKQFYLGCLAHASYLIGSKGEAAVIDPQRDVDQYIAEAEAQGLKIKYVIETHLHADFVSGHGELAERTGAEIVFGRNAGAAFRYMPVADGDELRVGDVVLRVMETPGHTPESISILVIDTAISERPQKVLTGDTLFIGDVGRPDLAGAKGFTSEQMAGMLYDSLHEKLLSLDDSVEVFPAHGAGSMCGRNISKETSSTIGQQRRFNYALAPMSKDEFVQMMTTGIQAAPQYFPRDAEINRAGAPSIGTIAKPRPLTPAEVKLLSNSEGYLVLDIRSADQFGAGTVPGAINIGLGGQFASWAGTLIAFGAPLILVAEDEAKVEEAVMRLARVGIESVKGYLQGGIEAWRASGLRESHVRQISVEELNLMLKDRDDLQVIDVRRPAEYAGGHVPSAKSHPLGPDLRRVTEDLDIERPTAVICAGGYRSSAATSLLAPRGFKELLNVTGGTGAWVNAGYPVE